MNSRIKEIRKAKGLSQEKFGEQLGVTKTSISKMELGTYNVTESMIKLICSEFNVSEEWLRYGDGDMFANLPKDELDKLAARYKLNPLAKRIVECFVNLEENEMNAVLKLVKDIASTTYDEISVAKEEYNDSIIDKEWEVVDDIDGEVKRYRLELEAEKKGTTSSVYGDINEPQAK